jgi:DNA-binding CsgD family transcriptional regulator
MEPTLLSKYSDLLLTVYRLAQEMPVAKFQDALLNALKSCIPFDSSMWGTATMTDGGLDIHSTHLHQSSEAMLVAYDAVKHQDSPAQCLAQQETGTMGFQHDVVFLAPEKQEIRQFCEDFGHRNFLVTSNINPHTKFAQWVSLYRKDAKQICTDEEIQMLASLAPHLMQALAINRVIHLDKLVGDTARERWSVAIADARGVPYHADKDFWKLILLEWDSLDHERLPQTLMDRLRLNDCYIGSHVVVQRSLEHGLLYLKVRRREKVDDLSAREYLVAQLLATGLTQKEVAVKLERTPHTVSSHVRSAFKKLEIDNVVLLPQHLALRGW